MRSCFNFAASHNRLGVGIQLCYLRHLGRVLGTDEAPDAQLLDFFTPIAIRPGANIYKRYWNASALSNLTGSRTERLRNGYWQPRCKQRKVSCLLKLSLRNSEGVASSYHQF
jgi:hypothetical protein